jgi:hypothetical protein
VAYKVEANLGVANVCKTVSSVTSNARLGIINALGYCTPSYGVKSFMEQVADYFFIWMKSVHVKTDCAFPLAA